MAKIGLGVGVIEHGYTYQRKHVAETWLAFWPGATCSEWWLRVVASGEVPAEAAPKKHSCARELFPDESEAGAPSPVDAALSDFGR